MSKIKSLYKNNIDKVWYESSNVIYSECDDNLNALKTLRIVFKNGTMYEYYNVNVNDYILFKEHQSQGKALNAFIKQYQCKKIGEADVNQIKEELNTLMNYQIPKNELFEKLEEIYNNLSLLISQFQHCQLSNDELSYVLFFIQKMHQQLLLTNFSNENIDLLSINENLNNYINLLQENSQNNIIQELKQKFLSYE